MHQWNDLKYYARRVKVYTNFIGIRLYFSPYSWETFYACRHGQISTGITWAAHCTDSLEILCDACVEAREDTGRAPVTGYHPGYHRAAPWREVKCSGRAILTWLRTGGCGRAGCGRVGERAGGGRGIPVVVRSQCGKCPVSRTAVAEYRGL